MSCEIFPEQIEQRGARIEPQLVDRAVYFELDVDHRARRICRRREIRRLQFGKTNQAGTEGERGTRARDFFEEPSARLEAAENEDLVERVAWGIRFRTARRRVEFVGHTVEVYENRRQKSLSKDFGEFGLGFKHALV